MYEKLKGKVMKKYFRKIAIKKTGLLLKEATVLYNYQTDMLLLHDVIWKKTLGYASNEFQIKWIELKIEILRSLI